VCSSDLYLDGISVSNSSICTYDEVVPEVLSVDANGDGIPESTLAVNRVMVSVGSEWTGEMPIEMALFQNFPNPFNPRTVIGYQLYAASNVHLVVFDILGREVAILVDQKMGPGKYEVQFDGSGLSSGVYFYRMQAGDFVQTRTLLLLK
jgi:hypothetical protein